MKRLFLLSTLAICGSLSAQPLTLKVDVVDPFHLQLTLSGTLAGPAPAFADGTLWVTAPISAGFMGNFLSISGNMTLGSLPLSAVYTGYNNYFYGGTIQLRGEVNGFTPFHVGDVMSGTATVTFLGSGHGLTQSMFDGQGVGIYWGTDGTPGFTTAQAGTFEGYAVSQVSTPTVPDQEWTILLLGLSSVGLITLRRRMWSRPA